jgi:hypothetical protein
LEECECQEEAEAEYIENKKRCAELDGEEFEQCAKEIREIYAAALEDCSPEEPSKCEEKREEAYQVKLEECLASGVDQDNCEAVAKEFAAQIYKECECQEKAYAEYEAHKQKCEGLDGVD